MKHKPAPTIEEDHDIKEPHAHPQIAALESVIKKAGIGANIDCNIIRKNDIVTAYFPYPLM